MKHELTTEQIKTLVTKAPELKEYLKELAPDAFGPEFVEFKVGYSLDCDPYAPIYIGTGNAPDQLHSKCLMWNKILFKVTVGSHERYGQDLGYLTIERL